MKQRDSHLTTSGATSANRALGLRETGTHASREVTALDRWLAQLLVTGAGSPPFGISLWNGEQVFRPSQPAVAQVEIGDRATLIRVLLHPELHFGDAYSTGRIRVHGELIPFLEELYRGLRRAMPPDSWRRRVLEWLTPTRGTAVQQARENIHHHYDLGNHFYRLWLDQRMVYTCAYYTGAASTLEQAQVAKMDHVCRKLQLRPGQSVVEAGCGWGALALHMARHYGVTVKAFNLSHQQIGYARERATEQGLAGRVEFIEDDYRNITGRFDAFVSIGMLEHVGTACYRDLGALLNRCLAVHGRGLIHTIGRNTPEPNNAWIEKRIFPGSCPPSLSQMAAIFEPFGFSVLDVENLRLHYARTCRDWLARFEAAADTITRMYDEPFVRAWRLYLCGSAAAFTTGTLQLFQVLFAAQENNQVPMTRDHLYAHPGTRAA